MCTCVIYNFKNDVSIFIDLKMFNNNYIYKYLYIYKMFEIAIFVIDVDG